MNNQINKLEFKSIQNLIKISNEKNVSDQTRFSKQIHKFP